MPPSTTKLVLASSLALSLGLISNAYAEGHPAVDAHAPQAHAAAHHHPTHAFGVFFGGTTTSDSTDFSVGAEYEYRFNQHFGAGIIYENTPDSPHFTNGASIALAAFHAHPWRGLRLTTAVGAEVGHGDEVHHVESGGHDAVAGDHDAPAPVAHARAAEGHEAPKKAGAEVLVRLGIAYDFEVASNFAVAPTVNVDFVNGQENVVYGMVFTYHF